MGYYRQFKKKRVIEWKKSYITYKTLNIHARNDIKMFMIKLLDDMSNTNNAFITILNNLIHEQKKFTNSRYEKIEKDPIFDENTLMKIKQIYIKIYDKEQLTQDELNFYKSVFIDHKLERENRNYFKNKIKERKYKKRQNKGVNSEYYKDENSEKCLSIEETEDTFSVHEATDIIETDEEPVPKKKTLSKNGKVKEDKKEDDKNIISKLNRKFINKVVAPYTDKFTKSYKRRKDKRRTYRLLIIIKNIINFQEINRTGCFKLLEIYSRKFEKENKNLNFIFSNDIKYILSKILFASSLIPNSVFKTIKKYHTRNFAGGSKKKTDSVLHRISHRRSHSPLMLYLTGGISTLSIFLFIQEIFKDMDKPIFKAFWCVQFIFYGFYLFGLCLSVFERFNIDYEFIFGFDIASNITISVYLLTFSIVLLCNHLVYYSLCYMNYGVDIYSLFLIFYLLMFILPMRFLFWSSRKYLLGIIGKLFTAPCYTVRFRCFFFADVLASYTVCFKSLYSVYFFNGVLALFFISIFPFIIRIVQCIRRMYDSMNFIIHSLNCIKYFSNIIGTICFVFLRENESFTLFWCGFIAMLLSTFINLAWDFKMDWRISRKKKLFWIGFYVFLGAYEIFVRFLWVPLYFKILDIYLVPILCSFLEINRRFLWALVRVELEHLNNCNQLEETKTLALELEDLFYVDAKNKIVENESGNLEEILIKK